MSDYLAERWQVILFSSWQHLWLVIQCLALATVLAVAIALLCYRSQRLSELANSVTAIGLTIPSFALIGLLVAPLGFGIAPAIVVITFYAALPILRNAVVGLAGVPDTVVESARGIGMSRLSTLLRVELPMAWPVILTAMRVSGQMVMGVAAIAAWVLGPGLGGFIFSGLSRLGGANALASVLTGVIAVIVVAFILDLLLALLGRLTTSRGLRV
ncbi:ABC transporter permease [Kocuria palustris]|uniref:ABC transporter permease n=1 Tax=Kocuria palustris TaxID=71999 RepID=UPI00246958D1|nr:ABC transporter permease [Kocuria palustris]MDH5152953.1 ABC transporter permease [Kocuria palustris]